MRNRSPMFAVGLVLLLAALIGAYWAGRSSVAGTSEQRASQRGPQVSTIYTCSMHPQVRVAGPGLCPFCRMPLVPATSVSPGTGEGPTVTLSPRDVAMARVETVPIERRRLDHEVRSVGRVEYNETSLATITARVDGYAERLFVNFTGVEVRAGDHLVEIYSPELVVAQQELMVATEAGRSGALVQSTAEKIRRLGLTAGQVEDLIEHRRVTERLTLLSPIAGTVIERNVTTQGAFKAGDVLYRIANLDTLWAYVEVYESQLPLLRYGQRVSLTAEAVSGRTFEGLVTFVTPLVDEKSRTVRAPVHIDNTDHVLKPGMFVNVELERARAGGIVVPDSAVIDTGTRQLVFVEKAPGHFEPREVKVGLRAEGKAVLAAGVEAGERVAAAANFLLDSESRLRGSASVPSAHEGH